MNLPIAFRTNESKYSFSGSPRLINAYAEQTDKDAKAPLSVMPCAGMKLFATVSGSPCRGTIFLEDADCAYSVHSSGVFKVTYDGSTATVLRVGVIPGTDVVQLSRNQAAEHQISVHCEAGEYYIEADSVKIVSDVDLPTPVVTMDHVGGYTAYGLEDRRFFLSSINDCATIDGTDFATAEQSPGPLIRIKANKGDLFLFKSDLIEQWRNTGNADFPFEPMATIQRGLKAPNAVAAFDNTLAWPGNDAIVYVMAGTQGQRISNHGIERLIESETSQEAMLGFAHTLEGHQFYTLTGTDWTRCYDAATQFWHSRESYRIDRWRGRFPFRAWGKVIVGDELTGNLYELDKDTFEEGDDPLLWGVDFPIMHAFPNGAIVDALHLDVATGNGLLGESAPKLMLSWSVDGGATFKGNRELSIGGRGDRVRVTTRRLGRFGPKGIQFRIRVSDPVIRCLVAADVEVRPIKK